MFKDNDSSINFEYITYEETTHELHAKIKQRAKMNNRSLNSEIIAAIEESLAKQSSASVYIDDAERMAEQQSDMVKKIVFDTLKELNKKDSS